MLIHLLWSDLSTGLMWPCKSDKDCETAVTLHAELRKANPWVKHKSHIWTCWNFLLLFYSVSKLLCEIVHPSLKKSKNWKQTNRKKQLMPCHFSPSDVTTFKVYGNNHVINLENFPFFNFNISPTLYYERHSRDVQSAGWQRTMTACHCR